MFGVFLVCAPLCGRQAASPGLGSGAAVDIFRRKQPENIAQSPISPRLQIFFDLPIGTVVDIATAHPSVSHQTYNRQKMQRKRNRVAPKIVGAMDGAFGEFRQESLRHPPTRPSTPQSHNQSAQQPLPPHPPHPPPPPPPLHLYIHSLLHVIHIHSCTSVALFCALTHSPRRRCRESVCSPHFWRRVLCPLNV